MLYSTFYRHTHLTSVHILSLSTNPQIWRWSIISCHSWLVLESMEIWHIVKNHSTCNISLWFLSSIKLILFYQPFKMAFFRAHVWYFTMEHSVRCGTALYLQLSCMWPSLFLTMQHLTGKPADGKILIENHVIEETWVIHATVLLSSLLLPVIFSSRRFSSMVSIPASYNY